MNRWPVFISLSCAYKQQTTFISSYRHSLHNWPVSCWSLTSSLFTVRQLMINARPIFRLRIICSHEKKNRLKNYRVCHTFGGMWIFHWFIICVVALLEKEQKKTWPNHHNGRSMVDMRIFPFHFYFEHIENGSWRIRGCRKISSEIVFSNWSDLSVEFIRTSSSSTIQYPLTISPEVIVFVPNPIVFRWNGLCGTAPVDWNRYTRHSNVNVHVNPWATEQKKKNIIGNFIPLGSRLPFAYSYASYVCAIPHGSMPNDIIFISAAYAITLHYFYFVIVS